jgi:hypothetical protein
VCGAQWGICRVNTFFQSRSLFFFLYKAKDLSAPPSYTVYIYYTQFYFYTTTFSTHVFLIVWQNVVYGCKNLRYLLIKLTFSNQELLSLWWITNLQPVHRNVRPVVHTWTPYRASRSIMRMCISDFNFYFLILVCEAIGTAATPGLLCQPRVIVKMIVEKQMECRLSGETEVLGENLPQFHLCPS